MLKAVLNGIALFVMLPAMVFFAGAVAIMWFWEWADLKANYGGDTAARDKDRWRNS